MLAGQQPSIQKMVRKYRSRVENLQWERKGLTMSVINGQAILDVQVRIEEARFVDIDITPLGADRVFIRSLCDADVLNVINDAYDFFYPLLY